MLGSHGEGLAVEVAGAAVVGSRKKWRLVLVRGVVVVDELHEQVPLHATQVRFQLVLNSSDALAAAPHLAGHLIERLRNLDQHPHQPADLVPDRRHVGLLHQRARWQGVRGLRSSRRLAGLAARPHLRLQLRLLPLLGPPLPHHIQGDGPILD
jgi:hypothetical protein